MRRSIVYGALAAVAILLGGLPFRGHDIALLRPVQVIYGEKEQGLWYVKADTGDVGRGATWEEAVENMENTAPGTIFQGTVDYVILKENTPLAPVLADERLSPNCTVCRGAGEPELENVAAFLQTHKDAPTLGQLRERPTKELPVLIEENEGFSLQDSKE